jgi:hypothetical protein
VSRRGVNGQSAESRAAAEAAGCEAVCWHGWAPAPSA